jgi:hypothetical protein
MTELFENQELAAAQRNRFVSDEEIKHITNIENRANNRRKLEKIFDDKWKMYHELRKEYENKRAACIKKFYELFAPSILNHVKVQLENRQYKWAWYRICIHFGKMSGGTSAAVNIRSILSHLTFKPESRTFSEHRHILESYFTQLMAIGEVLSESYKYEILRNSVQRGSKLFDDIFISLTSHANPTYDLLLRLITEKSNELNVKKVVSLTMEEDDYHDDSKADLPKIWNKPVYRNKPSFQKKQGVRGNLKACFRAILGPYTVNKVSLERDLALCMPALEEKSPKRHFWEAWQFSCAKIALAPAQTFQGLVATVTKLSST